MAHISLHNELKTPLLSQHMSGCKEKASEKISFFQKLVKAKELGTTNKGNNPIIGIANWMGRFSRSSSDSETDEKIMVTSINQFKRQPQSLIEPLALESVLMLNEEDSLSTISHSSQNIEEDDLFENDSEESLSRLCELSRSSQSSQATVNRLLEDDKTDLDSLSHSSELFSLSQDLNSSSKITQLSYRSKRGLNKAIQTEPQQKEQLMEASLEAFDTSNESKKDQLLHFFWGSIKFALLPLRIFLLLIRFFWNFDENMASIHDFFIHSGNMIKQSDLFLTSINDSELVYVAATLIAELEEMTSNLRELSFDKNLSQIIENSAKITQDLAQGEKLKAIIENLLVILDSINSLSRHLKPGLQSSFSAESYYEKVSDILTSLNTILDDMVFKGPFKGLMGAWDKYRKDRLESYEKLHNKEQFEEAVAKEVRDLEIVFKRYHALLDKAKVKGFHNVTVAGFNNHLSRLTSKTHLMQSEVK